MRCGQTGGGLSKLISTLSNNVTAKKNAFTLAEVLITLGIIGVVAALTLPTLVANYKKQELVTQLKKSVNIVENLARRITTDEGVSEFGQSEFVAEYLQCYSSPHPCFETNDILKKYLNVIDAEPSANNSNYTIPSYKNMSNSNYSVYTLQKLVLADGSIIYSRFWQGANQISPEGFWDMYIDINGEKGPNILGRDLFHGRLLSDGRFVDYSSLDSNIHPKLHNCLDYDTLVEKECYLKKIQSDGWKMNY